MRRIALLIAAAIMAVSGLSAIGASAAGSACVTAYAAANGQELVNQSQCVDLP